MLTTVIVWSANFTKILPPNSTPHSSWITPNFQNVMCSRNWGKVVVTFTCTWKLFSIYICFSPRELDELYPDFPSEATLIRNLMASPTALTPSNHLYLLSTLVLNHQRLAVGGILLPKLIEFYHWLHSHLEYQLTCQQAQDLSIGQVVEVVSKHCLTSTKEYLLTLYDQVKGISYSPCVPVGL